MSIDNYNRALSILESNKINVLCPGERSERIIKLAEKAIGHKFIGMYRDFIKKYGAVDYKRSEIYGIFDENFENSAPPDGLWYTLKLRKTEGLPNNLFVVYLTGFDEILCLDFNKINLKGEPAIVSFMLGAEEKDQKYDIVYSDFGDLLLDLVK